MMMAKRTGAGHTDEKHDESGARSLGPAESGVSYKELPLVQSCYEQPWLPRRMVALSKLCFQH